MIVYVTEQGALVKKRQGRLRVSKGPNLLTNVHLFDLEQLVLFGQIQLSTQAIRALLRQGTDTVFLTQSGRFLGRLSSGLGKNIELRRRQFEKLADQEMILALARSYVRGKLHNCMVTLRRHNRLLRSDRVASDTAAIRRCIDRLKDAETLDQIRGHEGAGSASYFSAVRSLFKAPGMAFFRRQRRPPPDPVNILLSLGYTILGNLVHGLCESAGLDPYLGALHCTSYGRPSLALDLIEEFRPVLVDIPALRAVNTKRLAANDFIRLSEEQAEGEQALWRDRLDRQEASRDHENEDKSTEVAEPPPPRQVIITSAGLKKWILALEHRLEEKTFYEGTSTRLTYRQVLREQVYRFARQLKGEDTYEPFLLRW